MVLRSHLKPLTLEARIGFADFEEAAPALPYHLVVVLFPIKPLPCMTARCRGPAGGAGLGAVRLRAWVAPQARHEGPPHRRRRLRHDLGA